MRSSQWRSLIDAGAAPRRYVITITAPAADAAEPGINGYTPPDITVPNDDFGTQTHRSNQWDTRRFALQTSDGFKCQVLGFSPAVGKRIRCMGKTDGMAAQPKPLSAVAPDLTNYGSALSFRQRAGGRLSGCAAYHLLIDAGHTAMLHDEP